MGKKFAAVACCMVLLLSAAAPAAFAIDPSRFASGNAVLYYKGRSSGSAYQDHELIFNNSDSFDSPGYQTLSTEVLVPNAGIGLMSYIYCLSWLEQYDNSQKSDFDSFVSAPLTSAKLYKNGEVLSSASFSKVPSGSYKASFSSGQYVYFDYALVAPDDRLNFDAFFAQFTLTFACQASNTFDFLDVVFADRKSAQDPDRVYTYPVVTLSSESDTEKIVAALDKVSASQISSSKDISNSLGLISTDLDAFKEAQQQYSEELKKTLDDFFNGGGASSAVEEGVSSGIESFYEKVKQEASDKLSSALNKISEAMPVDLKGLQTSFQQLLTSVSTHETSASLTLPAGKVNLMGKDLTFWDEQAVSFDEYFDIPGMQLLLLPLRFLFVFGMAKYLMYYFKKLEKLITLHTDG